MALDQLLESFHRAWNAGERPGFESCLSVDVHYEDPLTPEPIDGLKNVEKHARRLWVAFPDARIERNGPRLTDGEFACSPFRLLATHKGELEGLPATNRFITVSGIFYAELDESRERIARVRAFFDAYGAAMQLGVLPKPGSLGEKALLMLRGFGIKR